MLTHKQLVEIAARWLRDDRRCVHVFTEACVPHVAEQPDAIGFASTLSYVVECKASLSDLGADRLKPFRMNADGMGAMRFYLIEHGGEIRAENVDEDWGWGVLEYNPLTEQVKQTRPPSIGLLARNWRYEMILLLHYLSLATREAGKSAGECRKSAQGKIPAKFHDDIRKLVAAGGACPSRFIAREICKLMPRDGVGKVSKWLVDDIRAGRIKGLKAEGNPAEITIAA